jgi:hypothetical protein
MAKVLGKSGRYVSDEAVRQRRRLLLMVCAMIAVLGVINGVIFSFYIPPGWLAGWGKAVILLAALVCIWAIDKWANKNLTVIEKKRDSMQRGAAGEVHVGNLLTTLPDDFCVINDLSTPSGNIDHVVVGPTGVFALDAKAWRGVVKSDGAGELLLNDSPTQKQEVRLFVRRMMGVREKVLALAPGIDIHFKAVFVFTRAWVSAKWGTTASLHCITDDQLRGYIAEKDIGKRLNNLEINQIARAFQELANLDKEFAPAAVTHSQGV